MSRKKKDGAVTGADRAAGPFMHLLACRFAEAVPLWMQESRGWEELSGSQIA